MKDDLLIEIARCKELSAAKTDNNHACYSIVNSQGTAEFQIPEPWNGHIDTAKILFISSNPSIDENERYPIGSWNDTDIINFFENRFKNMPYGEWSRYWKSIFKWASWILLKKEVGQKLSDTEIDELKSKIAITEIVHCKSTTDTILSAYCQKTCFNKHFRKVIELFNGKYIVAVGKIASDCINSHLDKVLYDGKIVIHTPHPNRPVKGLTDKARRECFFEQIEKQS